jgi:hypothetical protein
LKDSQNGKTQELIVSMAIVLITRAAAGTLMSGYGPKTHTKGKRRTTLYHPYPLTKTGEEASVICDVEKEGPLRLSGLHSSVQVLPLILSLAVFLMLNFINTTNN